MADQDAGRVGAAKDSVARIAKRVTGQEFKQEFRGFTEATATVAQGLYVDNQELRKQIKRLESRVRLSMLVAGAAAALSVILAVYR